MARSQARTTSPTRCSPSSRPTTKPPPHSSGRTPAKCSAHEIANQAERPLGHAVRLWPELEPALREAAPTGLDLTPEAAIGFLRDAAPALEQSGFGVLAPPWWTKRLRLKLEA